MSGLAALLALVLVAPGLDPAEGAIPNKGGTYSACLTKSTGAIEVINYPKVKCAKGQRLIKWNAKGPAGARGPQETQGAQGPQGPAGPADWNAIGNKPAGFADGVDDGAFVSQVYGPYGFSDTPFMPGGQILFMLQTTRNVDVECSIFPFLGPAFWNEELRQVALQSNGDLARYMAWSTPNGGIGQARVRCRTYSEGIAPAVLKKVLKNAKVTVKLEGLRKRG